MLCVDLVKPVSTSLSPMNDKPCQSLSYSISHSVLCFFVSFLYQLHKHVVVFERLKVKKKPNTFILTKHTPTITMLTICQLNPYTRIDSVYLKPQVTVSIRIFF